MRKKIILILCIVSFLIGNLIVYFRVHVDKEICESIKTPQEQYSPDKFWALSLLGAFKKTNGSIEANLKKFELVISRANRVLIVGQILFWLPILLGLFLLARRIFQKTHNKIASE